MSFDLNAWLKSGCYLPPFLRDFHDQKEVFKTIHASIDPENLSIKRVSWVDGHCYVIDIFLWWMAKRGYTLQRTRQKGPFNDLTADIETRKQADTATFKDYLDSRRASAKTEATVKQLIGKDTID